MKKTLNIEYEVLRRDELRPEDAQVLAAAEKALDTAYNPYSHFAVGAALRLDDGTVVTGSNQENLAYPSGLCAERTAMFAASAQHPGKRFEALAIVGRTEEGELMGASPCGACRQVMQEYEAKSGKKMRVILYQKEDEILVVDGVETLLPFAFSADL